MRIHKKYDILIIGNSNGFDLVLAEHLSRAGLSCIVIRKASSKGRGTKSFSAEKTFTPQIVWLKNRFDFLPYAWRSKAIISFTGSLINYLYFLWPVRWFLGLPPVIQWFTGSDATELMAERSIKGVFFRQYLRFTKLNIGVAYPHALKNYIRYRIPNLVFLPFPYFLPTPISNPDHSLHQKIRFLHASHLDWKATDSGKHRNSTKGNDRFIRAFARAVKDGLNAECVILDRGSDRFVARELISSLGAEDAFIWKPTMNRDDLIAEIVRADVVVDQFDVGAFGGIAIEAMALGKPVLVYINARSHILNFATLPPVLNAYGEDEIYTQLLKCKDAAYLQAVGKGCQEWAMSFQSPEAFIPRFLFYFSVITGHPWQDYLEPELS